MYSRGCARIWMPRRRSANRLDENRGFVFAGAHLPGREDAVPPDPLERLVESLFRVWLEHQPLARTPAPRVHLIVKARRELLLIVVSVKFGPQIDVALGTAQRAKIFAYILRVRRAGDHRRDHERGVDDLTETELLDEIIRPAEQRSCRHLAVDQQFHAVEQQAVPK